MVGSPKNVGGSYYCLNNKLTNLIGSPNQVGRNFDCSQNNKLTSLFGVPKIIKKDLFIKNDPNLLDISDIWNSDIGDSIYFDLNSGMAILPLIKFDIVDSSSNNNNINIIHGKNRGSSKQNIIDFQYELMERGFVDNAKWKP